MEQKVKLVARTFEIDNVHDISGIDSIDLIENTSNELTLLSGKAAGVCYMPDDYFEKGIQDECKALKRAEITANSGHHSVFEHGHITFVLRTNKMIAMILNSLGVYTTSEKSARYTKMQPETELEMQMYNKWKEKIQELILNKYPNTDDDILNTRMRKALNIEDKNKKVVKDGKLIIENVRLADEILETNKKSETLPSMKLAMENARYMISVFTPTTMMYTVSFRQLMLIINYFDKLCINLEHSNENFDKKLLVYIKELKDLFRDIVGDTNIKDNKNGYIRFLEAQHIGEVDNNSFKEFTDMKDRLHKKNTVIGDCYTVTYKGSLAMLAQAQRHRTLRYTMLLEKEELREYYVPPIIKDADLEEEWIKDIKSLEYCVPQGTMVRITEQGLFEDFVVKCKERMCGRAQLEIMKKTEELINIFLDNKDNLCYSNRKLLEDIIDKKAVARCKFKDFKCTEGCQWGPKEALNRLV